MKKIIIFCISAILALGTFSCAEKTAGEAKPSKESPVAVESLERIMPVKTMPIELTTIKRTVISTASLVAEEETYLAPAIPGKIRNIVVDVNDNVKKGQLLVKMDKSQLAQTKLQYANLKKDLARMDTLIQYGSITQQSYDQMKTQVNVTKTALKNLEENTELRAPYKGVITGKFFNDGENFSGAPNTQAGKAAIVSLVKMDVLKVYINLSESYLPLLEKGQIAKVKTDVYKNEIFEAKVFRIYPTINSATRTFTVELRMDNADYRLRPGMYSKVTLELGDREALLVPSIAVIKQTGTNSRYIFTHKNGVCSKAIVEIGERVDDRLELIPNGVQAGDELIWAGHINLMDGDKVEVISK